MKTLPKFLLTSVLFMTTFIANGQDNFYKKIQLKDPLPTTLEKSNYNIWRTDFYICTGIAYAKTFGKTTDDFATFVGNTHSWESIKGKGLEPAVQILYGLIMLYHTGKFEIISESPDLVTMQFNRPYKEYFSEGTQLGVSLDEFERCLWGHIKILADRIGLNFEYKIVGDQIISSFKNKG